MIYFYAAGKRHVPFVHLVLSQSSKQLTLIYVLIIEVIYDTELRFTICS